MLARLKQKLQERACHLFEEFQFHAGSIKAASFHSARPAERRFQFHAGSIKVLASQYCANVITMCFNSMLARLKSVGANVYVTGSAGFQFHAGSIKGEACLLGSCVTSGFQFHAGSIKEPLPPLFCLAPISFNSMLARLKVAMRFLLYFSQPSFQFHAGSIKAAVACTNSTLASSFNSMLARLKVEDLGHLDATPDRFNSMLARLKPLDLWRSLPFLQEFQFHAGSIKAG